jgi:uncharacterized protein YdaL
MIKKEAKFGQATADFLEKNGYKEFKHAIEPTPSNIFVEERVFLKRLQNARNTCKTNERLSIEVKLTYMSFDRPRSTESREIHTSSELGIVGESTNYLWVNFRFYSMKLPYLVENLDTLERRIINAWDAAYFD